MSGFSNWLSSGETNSNGPSEIVDSANFLAAELSAAFFDLGRTVETLSAQDEQQFTAVQKAFTTPHIAKHALLDPITPTVAPELALAADTFIPPVSQGPVNPNLSPATAAVETAVPHMPVPTTAFPEQLATVTPINQTASFVPATAINPNAGPTVTEATNDSLPDEMATLSPTATEQLDTYRRLVAEIHNEAA